MAATVPPTLRLLLKDNFVRDESAQRHFAVAQPEASISRFIDWSAERLHVCKE